MARSVRSLVLAGLALLTAALAPTPAHALGPVDGEATLVYWDSDTEVGSTSASSSNVGGRAELWFFEKLGVSAALYRPEGDDALDGADFEYLNLDVKWRLHSPTENNFIAFGAGWQQVDLSGSTAADTSGPRLVVEGRVARAGVFYAYGRGAWLPDLDDWEVAGVPLTDGEGKEIEIGLQVKPAPFVQLFAGWRMHEDTFEGPLGNDLDFQHDGFLLGAGVNW